MDLTTFFKEAIENLIKDLQHLKDNNLPLTLENDILEILDVKDTCDLIFKFFIDEKKTYIMFFINIFLNKPAYDNKLYHQAKKLLSLKEKDDFTIYAITLQLLDLCIVANIPYKNCYNYCLNIIRDLENKGIENNEINHKYIIEFLQNHELIFTSEEEILEYSPFLQYINCEV
jgi:hypothetical protein